MGRVVEKMSDACYVLLSKFKSDKTDVLGTMSTYNLLVNQSKLRDDYNYIWE